MSNDAKKALQLAAEKMRLSARGYHRVIRVARTIADLALEESISTHHIGEALSFKNPLKSAG